MSYNENQISKLIKAYRFSAEKHTAQRRKDTDASPYINHPIQVSEILYNTGEVRDLDVIIAAVLHDTIEDTNTTKEEIREQFGERVLSIVMECTDDKSLPKEKRKELQVINASHKSPEAKQIKIVDKICNVNDLIVSPPNNWSEERIVEYYNWAKNVVNGLKGINEKLDNLFDKTLTIALNKHKTKTK